MKKSLSLIMSLIIMIMMSACDSSKTNPEKAANPSAPDGPVNPVVKTIMERRSIRSYKPEKVSRQEMDVILTCGINAPSAQNKQPWEIRVVDDPEFINGVTDIFKKQAEGNERMMKMVNDSTFKNMFRNAPTVVFVGCNDSKYAPLDCGLMIENMLIAAQSMNIGSVCLGSPVDFMKSPAASEYYKKLKFSEGYELLLVVGFGYPDETPKAKPREENKVVFIN